MGWANVASGVHVENGSSITARRPGSDPRLTLQVKVTTVIGRKADTVIDMLRAAAGEGECVCALSIGPRGNIRETDHVSVNNGKSELVSFTVWKFNVWQRALLITWVKLHVDGELAILAPVNSLCAGARLYFVGSKSRFEESTGSIYLDISAADRATTS